MKTVIIIGGGASGLVSAIYAAKSGDKVTILERNSSVGKKILITGNGKCNYFNENQNLDHYHSSDNKFLEKLINDKNLKEILKLFDSIGIVPKIKNGYYYPNSEQAISVRETLVFECKRLGVDIKTDYLVTSIIKKDKFIINNELTADKVIIAAGSKANPKTGSDGSGYNLALSLGHKLVKPLPALTSLIIKENIKTCKGIRCDVKITLLENEHSLKEEYGQLQITDYGISGICVFNISGRCARGLSQNKKEEVLINFLPDIANFIDYMDERNKKVKGRNISQLFDGLINYKLADYLLNKSKINKGEYWDNLKENAKETLNNNITALKLTIDKVNTFDNAQTCSGGIFLSEVNPNTLESLIVKDLYFAGEILDIDADCGGYNLTLAFITGMIAGKEYND